jgi:hypothetical protein
MKIIFYSYSGVHSAVLAGAAYLGLISAPKAASVKFSEVPFFGCKERKSQLRFLGDDQEGNQIFALGVKGEMELIPRSIENFLQLMGVSPHDLLMINTYPCLCILSKWGERLARWGFTTTGNFLAQQGLKKDYHLLLKIPSKYRKDSQS